MSYPQQKPQKQYQAAGTISQVMPIEVIPSKTGGNPFQKRVIVINDELNNPMVFELTGRNVPIGDTLQQGMQVTIGYNIKCNFWQAGGKWFTTLVAFAVMPNQAQAPVQQPMAQAPQQDPMAQPAQPAMAQPAMPAQQPMAQPAMPEQGQQVSNDQIPFN